MNDKRADTSSDSDFGDSWTIIDKTSFFNKMEDVIKNFEPDKVYEQYSEISNLRDCALNYQDDSNNDADADSDGISVISEPEEHLLITGTACTGLCNETSILPNSPKSNLPHNKQNSQPETRTPKKNKIKFNKPLTPPTTPIICDTPVFDKADKKHKKRSYIHHRNDKVSSFLNILVAGTIATAAGLALGHLMGSKSDCANLSRTNSDLAYKQLQYENYKLRNELQDLKRESWDINNPIHKPNHKTRRNIADNDSLNKTSDISTKTSRNKSQIFDYNGSFKVPEISQNNVFFGPKTYAESITSNHSDKDILETDLFDLSNDKDIKRTSKTDLPGLEEYVFPGIISSQELHTLPRNNTESFPNLSKPNGKFDIKDSSSNQKNKQKSDIPEYEKQKNRKTNQNFVLNDMKNNSQFSAEDIGKYKRKINKDQSHSKKGRSVSTGKETIDYENSVLSMNNKQGEKSHNNKENLLNKDDEQEQQFDCNNSQKGSKEDRKYKDKNQEKRDSNDYYKNNKTKNIKNAKYSEEKLLQKINEESEINNSYKKYNKKEKRNSKMSIEHNDKSISKTEIKPTKIRKSNDKSFKGESKNDRKKSDFKQVKRDKYEEWEMKKGYEYYMPSSKVFSGEQSGEEQMNKVKHFPSEKTISSCDEPIYFKSPNKKEHVKNNSFPEVVNSITENWLFETLCDNDTNSVDGSWISDLAKHREEQRNKQKQNKWISDLAKHREEQRNKQKQSDWLFERAKTREGKRNGAKWYFDYMDDREQSRIQEKNKQNKSKRFQKKSTNFKSKL